MDVEEFLEHHGIKGMRWGVRRSNPSGKSSGSSTGGHSSDAARAVELHSRVKTSGGTHTLSNQELQHLVTRLNLEQQFSRLTTQAKKSNPAAKFIKETLAAVGKQQAAKLAADATAKAVGHALKRG